MEGNDPGAYIPGHPVYVAQAALRAISRDMIAGRTTPAEARAQQLALKSTMTPRVRVACGMSAGMDDGEGDDVPDLEPHPYVGVSLLREELAAGAVLPRHIPDSTVAEDLTDRQREVLELLDVGLTYAEAGERLRISRQGVGDHVKRVRALMGIAPDDPDAQDEMRRQWRIIRADEEQAAYDAEIGREWGA